MMGTYSSVPIFQLQANSFCSDDPWNQTAADNAEWLQRFKRDVGITQDGGPGLPDSYAWAMEQGGTGFAPPYACPKMDNMDPFDGAVPVEMRDGAKPFIAGPTAANSFVDTLAEPQSRPAKVFCSRELEAKLLQFAERHVLTHGDMPSDEILREAARQFLQTETTSADDDSLLSKFKDLVYEKMPFLQKKQSSDVSGASLLLPEQVPSAAANTDLDSMLQDMDFEQELDFMSSAVIEENDAEGGVSLF